MTGKSFESFGIRDAQGHLTNAGVLLADDVPIRWSRLFCTRWNGLDKSGGIAKTSLSRSTVQRAIKELTEAGKLEREGSKKTGSWVVKD